MDLYKKIENFNKRWNLVDDESAEENIIKFRNRVMNIFKNIDSFLTDSSISKFCSVLGIEEHLIEKLMGGFSSYNVVNALTNEKDFVKYLRIIEIIFNLEFENDYVKSGAVKKKALFLKMQDVFNYSTINARIEQKGGEILILPAGEKLLDEEVIDQVLSFLNGNALLHFVDALKDYEQHTEKCRVKSVEHLRRALEEQLRYELGNKKGLKKNILELGEKLKSMSVNNDIKNTVIQLIRSLDDVFNENSKHNDGIILEPENEYLIYQIALLMRYIHKIMKEAS
ncbi:MAG: hypothetical protein H8D45_26110 [Bacteroidetes bacterium]|nr:hypothetical protein [Bacteroidota bacterium]